MTNEIFVCGHACAWVFVCMYSTELVSFQGLVCNRISVTNRVSDGGHTNTGTHTRLHSFLCTAIHKHRYTDTQLTNRFIFQNLDTILHTATGGAVSERPLWTNHSCLTVYTHN